MIENIICECGNNEFWFQHGQARCCNCDNQYKEVGDGLVVKRLDKEKNEYTGWEKC